MSREGIERLAERLYNTPVVHARFVPYGGGGTRFILWHELTDKQKTQACADLAEALDELGLDVIAPTAVYE